MKTFQEFLNESNAGSTEHYNKWVKEKGHITGSSSSVLDDYSNKHKLDKDTHNTLVKHVFPQASDQRGMLKK